MVEQLCALRKPDLISRERRQEPPLDVNHQLQLGQFSLCEATSTLTLHLQLQSLVLFMPVQSQAPAERGLSSLFLTTKEKLGGAESQNITWQLAQLRLVRYKHVKGINYLWERQ